MAGSAGAAGPSKRATIREVARRAGVSVGTVSHVINGSARVRPETRAAVEEAVAELNFTPHVVARMLIGRRGRASIAREPGVPRLTAIGYVSTDYTARVRTLPHREDRALADRIDKTLGGPAANVAVVAAGLGAPFPIAAELLTVIGDDPDSDWAVSVLGARGVEVVALGPRKGRRLARCVILVEANGARTILYEGVDFPEREVLRILRERGRARPPHVLHWQGSVLPLKAGALQRARALGYIVSAQLSGAPLSLLDLAVLRALVARCDILFLNREAARAAVGWQGSDRELVERLAGLARGDRLLILTLADAGAVLFAKGVRAHVPAPAVEPVDATGAGDAFAGTFLATWLNGVAPELALEYAVRAASRAVTVPGAQEMQLAGSELQALTGGLRKPIAAA